MTNNFIDELQSTVEKEDYQPWDCLSSQLIIKYADSEKCRVTDLVKRNEDQYYPDSDSSITNDPQKNWVANDYDEVTGKCHKVVQDDDKKL